ncbi:MULTISPECIES: hypothetical protein [unclassified Leeuwenhoekiella]|uniref:CBU_0592 family membrane protein n=1 Tax=unclassified Leeuwenhoekiella TaxID=2615029 RepID=UPI000C5FCDC6|nr:MULTISPECIES: hypothetical protein [unclassified Leeuwenhoekiella]MAW94730.1 hypothetical protein [Leeuwenhoekiella sp.]MAW95505.1 hypothetical protein [Leeuwenhoekiella sp.]MBA82153.1 hypothetical protein [Leeuwenhoekiella sp.]|tara:strand:+ start:3475 stop:3711 length:237 start_codon:yes stop_codon:yes gene_type:complete
MTFTDWLGAIGVLQILLAYILNLRNVIATTDWSFILLNLIGAAMACAASVLLDYWPFIILEGIWTLTSFIALMNRLKV